MNAKPVIDSGTNWTMEAKENRFLLLQLLALLVIIFIADISQANPAPQIDGQPLNATVLLTAKSE